MSSRKTNLGFADAAAFRGLAALSINPVERLLRSPFQDMLDRQRKMLEPMMAATKLHHLVPAVTPLFKIVADDPMKRLKRDPASTLGAMLGPEASRLGSTVSGISAGKLGLTAHLGVSAPLGHDRPHEERQDPHAGSERGVRRQAPIEAAWVPQPP